mmetsp:Transcript_11716/g.32062  ORF Transcript_11716/g.32062 Transcript_11716/m.32062 type:complete len:238 (-) Transcript_11716:836-1549(-)
MSWPSTMGRPPLRRCGVMADSCSFLGPCVKGDSMEPETSTSTTALPPALHSRGGTLFCAARETAVSSAFRYWSRSALVGGFRHTGRFFSIFFASLPEPTAFCSTMKSSWLVASCASLASVSSLKSMASKADRNLTGICLELATCCLHVSRPKIALCVFWSTPAMMMFRRLRNMAMNGKFLDCTRSCQTSFVLPFSDSSVSQVLGTGIRSFSPMRSGSNALEPPRSRFISLNSSSVMG